MRKFIRIISLLLGIACMAAASYLFVDTQQEERVAQMVSHDVVLAFGEQIKQVELLEPEIAMLEALHVECDKLSDASEPQDDDVSDTTESQKMPAVVIDGEQYVALLSIPYLGLELPIAQNCSDVNLAKTPCVYLGSLADHDLVIAGHNYRAHFGGIHRLVEGASATLVDALGQVYDYTLVAMQQVDGTDTVSIVSGDWDMVLFTCVYGDNTKRDVLRFELVE